MSTAEKRQEYRLSREETVYIELASASSSDTSPAEILICNSIDISANGLQVAVDQPLEKGVILNVAIQPKHSDDPITLVAEVRWIYQVEHEGQWMTGLALLESDHTKLQQWKILISTQLKKTFNDPLWSR